LKERDKIIEAITVKDLGVEKSDFYNYGTTDAASISTADEKMRLHIAFESSMLSPTLPIKAKWN
jgi:hypothetical protein